MVNSFVLKAAVQLACGSRIRLFLNVLDIPPRPENLQNQNTVQLAIKSRIKLFIGPLR